MSEMVGYDGPIYMTHPTKAICPILLEDFRKITVDKKGETNFFTSQMIKDCMKKVVPLNLHQTVQVSFGFAVVAAEAARLRRSSVWSPSPAGGRRAGDQGLLRGSRPGSRYGPHQGGLGVRGLHRESPGSSSFSISLHGELEEFLLRLGLELKSGMLNVCL